MDTSSLNDLRIKKSGVVLANATELAINVIRSVVGNDVSDSLNGNRLTANTIRMMAQARFRRHLDSVH